MSTIPEALDALINIFSPVSRSKAMQSSHGLDDDEKSGNPMGVAQGPRVLLADNLGESVQQNLQKNGFGVFSDASLKDDALLTAMVKFQPHVVVVRSTKINKQHLSASPALALIVRAGAGYNTIDVESASGMGIFVSNCPGKNAIAVAELTMGHLLNLDRRISDNVAQLRAGTWNKKEFGKARGLFGRTLAVVGIGNIGRQVIQRASAFGMNVRGYSRSLTPQLAGELGITYCATLGEACQGADALTIHLPCNSHTKHMVDKQVLAKLNDGAYVINASRGGVVNEKDVVMMIQSKKLRYAPDVYENEPGSSDKLFADKMIASNQSIYGTHHIGASTSQASDAVGSEALRVITTFLNKGEIVNCVNLEESSPAKYSLTIRHKNVVGVLAACLTILKENNVNVLEMSNIVFKGAKSSCATLQVDEKPAHKEQAKLEALPNVYGVRISKK